MENYKALLSGIGTALKVHGFKKKGNYFLLFSEGNCGLINFQKSRDSSASCIKFTCNIGAVSSALAKAVYDRPVDQKVVVDDCQWKMRIGFIMQQKQDHWWQIDDITNIAAMEEEITQLLTLKAVPLIISHLTDSDLIESWIHGECQGITEVQKFKYLTTLLKIKNDSRLSAIIEELRSTSKGKSYENIILAHLKELQS